MKKIIAKLTLFLMGTCALQTIQALEIADPQNAVSAGSACLGVEEHELHKQKREENKDKESERGELINNAMYLTTHPLAAHGIYKISTTLDKVILTDGSIWRIHYITDQYIMNRWASTNDQIIISPASFFAPTDYQLTSQRTGESIYVSLDSMEVIPGDFGFHGQRLWVHSVDYLYDIDCCCHFYSIRLSDGSIWEVNTKDNFYASLIYPGDIVFIGVDESSKSPTYNILVHFNSLEYVHADCVAY